MRMQNPPDRSQNHPTMVASLQFAVRVRPSPNCDSSNASGLDVDLGNENIIINDKYTFPVDHAFPVSSSQGDIYDEFTGTVDSFLQGNNVTFVTMGRTNSGKTHTLIGSLATDPAEFGIVPRAAKHMFDHLCDLTPEFSIFFTIVEVPRNTNPFDGRCSFDEWIQKSMGQRVISPVVSVKECRTYNEFLDWLKNVKDNCLCDNIHKNIILSFTLHQKWMDEDKITSKGSQCSFIELGSIWSFSYGSVNNSMFQNLQTFTSGLDVISKVLAEIAEGTTAVRHMTAPYNVFIDLLKEEIQNSTKTVLLYCVSQSPLERSYALNDLRIINEIRVKCNKTWFCEATQCQSTQCAENQDETTPSLELNPNVDWWTQDLSTFETMKCSLNRIDEVTESGSRSSNDTSIGSELDNDDSNEMDEILITEYDSTPNDITEVEFTDNLDLQVHAFRFLCNEIVYGVDGTLLKLCNELKNTTLTDWFRNRRAPSTESSPPEQPGETASGVVAPCIDLQNIDARASTTSLDTTQLVPTDAEIHHIESLRMEIASLRATKDYLHEQKRELTFKMNEKKYMSREEERKLIEVDEAIDAIDSAMEFKNELICGRNCLPKSYGQEQGAQMLTERLFNLSAEEMRILLCKYFRKVVDLRQAGHKMEKVIADQDHKLEIHAWKIHALTNALRQTRVECEQKVMVMREQEKKYQVNFHHFAEGSSGASSSVDRSDNLSNASAPLLEISGAAAADITVRPDCQQSLTIPQQNLRRLQGSSTHTTKVTRKGNKLIIQQERSKKK